MVLSKNLYEAKERGISNGFEGSRGLKGIKGEGLSPVDAS